MILGIHSFDAENTNCRLDIASVFCGGKLVSYVPHPHLHPPKHPATNFTKWNRVLCFLLAVFLCDGYLSLLLRLFVVVLL